jgi:hypothetical protein
MVNKLIGVAYDVNLHLKEAGCMRWRGSIPEGKKSWNCEYCSL